MCDGITENHDKKYNIKINVIKGLFKIIQKIISSNIDRDELLLFYNIYISI